MNGADLFRNLIIAASSDSQISAREVRALRRIQAQLGISDDQATLLFKEASAQGLRVPSTSQERQDLFQQMLDIVALDTHFNGAQRRWLDQLRRKLQIDPGFYEASMDRAFPDWKWVPLKKNLPLGKIALAAGLAIMAAAGVGWVLYSSDPFQDAVSALKQGGPLTSRQMDALAERPAQAIAEIRDARVLGNLLAMNRPEFTALAIRGLKGTDLLDQAIGHALESGSTGFVDADLAASWIEKNPGAFAKMSVETMQALWKAVPVDARRRLFPSLAGVARALDERELTLSWAREQIQIGGPLNTDAVEMIRPALLENLSAVCRSPHAKSILAKYPNDPELARAVLALKDLPKLRAIELAFGSDVSGTVSGIRRWKADELLASFSAPDIANLAGGGPLNWESILKTRYEAARTVEEFRRGKRAEDLKVPAVTEGAFLLSELSPHVRAHPECADNAVVLAARCAHRQESSPWICDLLPTMTEAQIVSVLNRVSDPWLINLVLQNASAKAKPWLRENWRPLVSLAIKRPAEMSLASAAQWAFQVERPDQVTHAVLNGCPPERIVEVLKWVRLNDPKGFEQYVRTRSPDWYSKMTHSNLEALVALCKGFPKIAPMVEAQLLKIEKEASTNAGKSLPPPSYSTPSYSAPSS